MGASPATQNPMGASWLVLESPPAPTAPTFKTGQRVRHARFGEGVVIEAAPADGDEIITVAFESQGLKRLLASMAKLEPLEG